MQTGFLGSVYGTAARCEVGVIGVNFDVGSNGRPGARFGPEVVRRATRDLIGYGAPFLGMAQSFDALPDLHVCDLGDLTMVVGALADDHEYASQMERRASAGPVDALLVLGGDHSVTLPALRLAAKVHGPLSVLLFDAHPDTWPSTYLVHGSWLRQAVAEGLVDVSTSLWHGIRVPLPPDGPVLGDLSLWDLTDSNSRLRGRPVYVTVDVDVLDPAFAPGVSCPVPGGITSAALVNFMRAISGAGLDVVGADVVEVCPPHDVSDLTATIGGMTAAMLASILVDASKKRSARFRQGCG